MSERDKSHPANGVKPYKRKGRDAKKRRQESAAERERTHNSEEAS